MSTCQTCNQSMDECREQDKKLIQPFHGNYRLHNIAPTDKYCKYRYMRAFLYTQGCYDPVTERFYLTYGYWYTTPKFYKELLALPLCVWEDDYERFERVSCVEKHLEESLRIVGIAEKDINNISSYTEKYLRSQLFQNEPF